MTVQEVIETHVVRMRPGDMLWVRLGKDADVEDAEHVRDSVMELMPPDCSVILTEHHLVERLGVASLPDLLSIRAVIDRAIDANAVRNATEV